VSGQNRVALVIGSGAAKCTAALGLQKVLQREGIGVNMVIGCSGGGIFATLIALGYEAEAAEEMTHRLWTREITSQRNSLAILQVLFPKLFGFDGQFALVKDHLILERLREAFGERTLADTAIPLYIVTTDFMSGKEVVLTEGSLVDAIRASIAIPFIFKPWPVNGRMMIDGAMSNPLPIDVAIREGADVIIALGFQSEMQTRVSSIVRFAFQITTIMANNLLQTNLAFQNLAHHTEVISVIPEFGERIKAFDTSKIPLLIEAGEKAMEKEIHYIRRLLEMETT
jgi:NTE family protein